MSTNPFMDYQEQFFKLWNDNMDKMLESDAYKAMTKTFRALRLIPRLWNPWFRT